jgi:hypothetical protein
VSRHKLDPSALVAGVLFLTIAGRYLAEAFGDHRLSYAWTMPFVLGSIALIYVLRLIFRRRDS